MAETYTFRINTQDASSQTINKIKSGVTGLAAEVKTLAGAALGIGSLFAGFSFLKSSLSSFDAFEESISKINAALVSTKGVSGASLGGLTSAAKELSKESLFSKASIMDAQSMLLTFTQIRGEMVNKTMPAITDFATRFKMELPQAALMVGKAMNSPLVGMNRLQRMGVLFTAQQKETIKNFVATGQVAKAQQVILSELNTEFGGLAKAMTETNSGKLAMAGKQLSEFKIAIGELVSKLLVGLIPAFNFLVRLAKEFKTWITGDSIGVNLFKGAIITLTGAFIAYNLVTGIAAARVALITWWTGMSTAAIILNTLVTEGLSAAWAALDIAMTANPIGLVIAAVVGLAIAFAELWNKVGGFRRFIGGAFAEIVKVVMGVVHIFTSLAKIIGDVLTGNFSDAASEGKVFVKNFKNDFTKGWGEAWKEGSDKAANSKLKILPGIIGGGNKPGTIGAGAGNAVAQSAINTSMLGGASGGLGEAKTVKIDFHSPLMQINVPGGNGQDIVNKAPMTMEMLLRILNNMTLSQGATM